MRVTANGDLEWLAPLSFLISGIPLILIAYPATLQQSGLMDRDTAAGFTMLFSIVLIPMSLFFWAVTLLVTLGALIWGENRLRGRVCFWYICLAATLLLYGTEQRAAAIVACLGLAILVILPAAWLYLRTRRRRPVGA